MSTDRLVGEVINGYHVEDVRGRGGMGVVYRARQLRPNRVVALKVIAPELAEDPEFRRRFEAESEAAASIEHPNVIPIYEVNDAAGLLYVVMRYVDGLDLRELIRLGVTPLRAIDIASQVAGALDAAHRRGLVHRDVKPGNVLVSEPDHAYLADFGLTKRIDSESGPTKTGGLLGTIDYVAPEQVAGERIDGRADVYALGCVLFHALTGRVPYPRDSDLAKIYAHLNDRVPSVLEVNPDLPSPLDAVMRRGMAKKPDDRYPSAGDLARAARAALTGESTSHREQSVATGAAAPTRIPRGDPHTTPGKPSGDPRPPERPPPGRDEQYEVAAGPSLPTRPLARAFPRRRAMVGLAVALAAAVIGVEFATVVRPDATRDRVSPGRVDEPPIPVGSQPTAIAYGAGAVWVASAGGESVERVDPQRGRVTGSAPAGSEPYGVAAGEGLIWAVDFRGDALTRVDPRSMRVVGQPIRVGRGPTDVVVAGGAAWTANYEDDTLTRVDARTGERVATIPVGDGPVDVAAGFGAVWAANVEEGTLSRVNPRTNEAVGAAIPVGQAPESLATGAGAVWVANVKTDTVRPVDPSTNEVSGRPIAVGQRPDDVAVGPSGVWVANQDADAVMRIDPATREVSRPLRVGNAPSSLAVGADSIWVGNFQGETVVRIRP